MIGFRRRSTRTSSMLGNSDFRGHDLRTRPEDIDVWKQCLADRCEVVGAAKLSGRHPAAIRSGAEKQARTTNLPAKPLPEHDIRHFALGRGKRTPLIAIPRIHPLRKVVEQQRKIPATQRQHLLELFPQNLEIRVIAIANVCSPDSGRR